MLTSLFNQYSPEGFYHPLTLGFVPKSSATPLGHAFPLTTVDFGPVFLWEKTQTLQAMG